MGNDDDYGRSQTTTTAHDGPRSGDGDEDGRSQTMTTANDDDVVGPQSMRRRHARDNDEDGRSQTTTTATAEKTKKTTSRLDVEIQFC